MAIIGHKKQWKFLKKSFELGKVSHAYLFCGEKYLGKKTLAKEFVKLLQCQSKAINKPCQKCFSCLQIEKSGEPKTMAFHPDLNMVEAEGKEIKISQIKNLCRALSLKPYSSPYKTAIIDDAELMDKEAANALLKTLEEPGGQAVLFLISSNPERLPQTIVSRTQIIRFFPLPKEELEFFAKTRGIEEGKIKDLIPFSFGRPGLLFQFLTDPQKLLEKKKRVAELAELATSNLAKRFQYAKKMSEEESGIMETLESWLNYFRKNLMLSLMSVDAEKQGTLPTAKVQKIIKTIETVIFLISSTNVNLKLALEMIMLEL